MINKTNLGLVLEGGGVKCAYQVGALMALEEKGYSFKAVAGTSFGALNGALYLEGGVKKLFDFYTNITPNDIYGEELICDFVNNYNGDKEKFTSSFMEFITANKNLLKMDRNMTSDYYHNFVRRQINAEAVYKSDKEYLCCTLEVSNSPLILPMIIGAYFSRTMSPINMLISNGQIKTHIINKNDVNKSTLPLYIVASANYPFFNPLLIEDKYYLDGGITNNVPYEALLERGYEKLVIIRTKSDEMQGKIPQNENILTIIPSRNLGSSLEFSHDNIMELIKLGYLDAMAQIANQ